MAMVAPPIGQDPGFLEWLIRQGILREPGNVGTGLRPPHVGAIGAITLPMPGDSDPNDYNPDSPAWRGRKNPWTGRIGPRNPPPQPPQGPPPPGAEPGGQWVDHGDGPVYVPPGGIHATPTSFRPANPVGGGGTVLRDALLGGG